MVAKNQCLVIEKDETFVRIVRWETKPFVWKAISAIDQVAPMMVHATNHGLTDGWRAAIVGVQGMVDANSPDGGLRDTDFVAVTVLDSGRVTFNETSAAEFDAYTSGGYLKYYTAVDLTGYAAMLNIFDASGTVLATYSSGTGEIVIDPTAQTITITIGAAVTALYTWTAARYELEMTKSGTVTAILEGEITVDVT